VILSVPQLPMIEAAPRFGLPTKTGVCIPLNGNRIFPGNPAAFNRTRSESGNFTTLAGMSL